MYDFSKYKTSVENEKQTIEELQQLSNPMSAANNNNSANALSHYTQTIPRTGYDKDIAEVLEVVNKLNNMAPQKMPLYEFDINKVNGDRFYKPDGSLLLVREFDSDVVRDYYASYDEKDIYSVNRILEHDMKDGRLRVKIEPVNKIGSRVKTNITIFDIKINNKYIIFQLAEDGTVCNITEFTGKGKSFQTLFRNMETLKPARYLEGKDNKETGFVMLDCIFNKNQKVVRIKKFSNKKEINIDYTDTTKSITVKTKA